MDTPLIAILRGISPASILKVSSVLIEQGFTAIEVPLNSPDALKSIKLLADEYGERFVVGAGTVTNLEQAEQVIDTGANLIVTPNFNADVVKLAVANKCICLPGVMTPTEAFAAITAGADGLKVFPINALGLEGFKAFKSVLPKNIKCYPVGGINPTKDSIFPFLNAGADGFGLGSSLYQPSMELTQISQNAAAFIQLYRGYFESVPVTK